MFVILQILKYIQTLLSFYYYYCFRLQSWLTSIDEGCTHQGFRLIITITITTTIIIIIEGLSLLKSIPLTTAYKQTQTQMRTRKLLRSYTATNIKATTKSKQAGVYKHLSFSSINYILEEFLL